MTKRIPVGVFFALFTVSGFAGLIYESIWSHYLKLFLGHAAYAQTLVLAIFMGGMALGSWLVSRFTRRIPDLLYGYALAELGIGLLAVVFHGVFVSVTGWSFDTVIPALGSPALANAFKLVLASLLILPASVLLGSTFPLMSAGIIRLYPEGRERALAWLYFTNSLGAAVGVLASGFFLMDKLGLPGTILTAGLLNVTLALVVWALTKRVGSTKPEPGTDATTAAAASRLTTAIQGLAFVTGAASFIYEIAWIRMLTMGLGASTHAFEVMLAAFILGMALGGLALALRTPRQGPDVAWLGGILVAKGLLAILALAAYAGALDFIHWMLAGLQPSDQGYTLFNVTGLVSSMIVMLPSAFCAGITLPLATAILIRRSGGEAAIGRVYAANTAGCIAGTVFATHVGMEWLGVAGLTGFGAMGDIGLGVAVMVALGGGSRRALAGAAASVLVAIVAFSNITVDRLKMASGVFRQGGFLDPTVNKLEFNKDGKTATISVVSNGGHLAIRTNGKTDAGVNFTPGAKPTWDESTMILLGALPIMFKPDARAVANIGFGSGMTTNTLLSNEKLGSVDTIEIEPAMIEGARFFEKVNYRAFSDPRSHIRIEDAKTFFAAHQSRFDVIVSEPSNPWVSGVATLFSDEFYGRIRGHLREGGLLVQWLHVYEIDFDLVSSILKALGRNFSDYVIYTSQPGDIVVIATRDGKVPPLTNAAFDSPGMRSLLARVGYLSLPELRLDRIASRKVIEPLVERSRYPVNSDYFPVVDQNAARTRFLKLSARDVATIPKAFVPFGMLMDGDSRIRMDELDRAKEIGSTRVTEALVAAATLDYFDSGGGDHARLLDSARRLQISFVRQGIDRCGVDTGLWLDAVEDILRVVTPILHGPEVDRMFARVEKSACYAKLDDLDRERLVLYRSFHERNVSAMLSSSDRLLASSRKWSPTDKATFVLASLSARVVQGDVEGARRVWEAQRASLPEPFRLGFNFRVLLAHLGLDAEAAVAKGIGKPESLREAAPNGPAK